MAFLREPRIVRCDNPEGELWRYVRWVFSPAFMRRAVQDVHKDTLRPQLVEDKVNDCARCVEQAGEYFTASATASPATSPVLSYYGMLSLAAALGIVANRDLTLRSMPRGHGLLTKNMQNWSGVLDAECRPTGSGLFSVVAAKDLTEWCAVSLR